MVTAEGIESAYTAWAQANDDVRAAFVVGSRARVDHPADAWADLDIIMFARNADRYHETIDWIRAFAPVWIALSGRTAGGDPERLVLFQGGLQVDFVFHPDAHLAGLPQFLASGPLPDDIVRGTRVLVDKEGVLTQLPPPGQPATPQPPDPAAFRRALDGFWFAAVYAAKQLRRGELWPFQNASSGMTGDLLQMVAWHACALSGGDCDTWHGGKFVAEWAGDGVYDDLQGVFARLEVEDGRRAMHVRMALFSRLAREVATQLGLPYPSELEQQITATVNRIIDGQEQA